MLKKLGIRAGTAANGIEAIQSLERQPYEIVLMDIEMPEMNGIEATKIIRERWPEGPKIIVVTDYDSNRYRDLCLDAGASEFLNKPINMEELTMAIERNTHGRYFWHGPWPTELPSIPLHHGIEANCFRRLAAPQPVFFP
jgi:CheY-like chemotaxis protein